MSDFKNQAIVYTSPGPDSQPERKSDISQLRQDPAAAVNGEQPHDVSENETAADQIEGEKKSFWAYFRTKEFYITLLLG